MSGNEIGRRVFAARGTGAWSPTVVAWSGWEEKYLERAQGTDVLPLDEAIAWANGLIAEAVAAGKPARLRREADHQHVL